VLAEKLHPEIEAILAKYPPERKKSAVMPLLFLVQREYGFISQAAVEEVAELLEMEPTQVGSLVGFYTLYHAEPGGKYRIQVCTDLPCALRGAEEFAHKLCENLAIRIGETTADGMITVEEVMCLAACDKAPMFQVQQADGIHYHENQTVDSAMELIDELRQRGADD
jgi:NADH-quinone oxidoreductase subunit E